MKKQNRFDLLRNERGASLVETAAVLPLFLLLLFGAVDFGRALYIANEIAGAAHAAVMYGTQNPTDTSGMKTVALDSAPDVPGLSVTTPTYGCECAIASSTYVATCPAASQPTCSTSNLVYRVNVTVSGDFSPMFPWPGVPSLSVFSTTASMRSAGS